jgi:hypothetical protein
MAGIGHPAIAKSLRLSDGYPVAGQPEDIGANPVADAGKDVQVRSERRLTVGSRPHEIEPAT